MSLFYHKTCKTIQNLFNNMVIAVNGSQPLAVATLERSRLATFLAKNCIVGFVSFVARKSTKSSLFTCLRQFSCIIAAKYATIWIQ
jgi:hypothetical protein